MLPADPNLLFLNNSLVSITLVDVSLEKKIYLFLDAITNEGTTNLKVKIHQHEGVGVKAE